MQITTSREEIKKKQCAGWKGFLNKKRELRLAQAQKRFVIEGSSRVTQDLELRKFLIDILDEDIQKFIDCYAQILVSQDWAYMNLRELNRAVDNDEIIEAVYEKVNEIKGFNYIYDTDDTTT